MELTVLKPIFAESASQLVQEASQFTSTILLKKDHWVIDAKSLLGVIALSLQPGQKVEIEVKGEDVDAIQQAFLKTGLFQ
ncbi:HPr family phosphocarrier protein [Bacillaceae bacterium S4-13-58]